MSLGMWPFSIAPDTTMIPGADGEPGTDGLSVIAVDEAPVAEIVGYSVAVHATTGDIYNWVDPSWVLVGNIGVGVVGPQGPQGIQGPPGETAIAAFDFTGPWQALGDYANTMAVEYGGSVYVVSDDSLVEIGTPPEDGLGEVNPGWALFVAEGAPGPQGPAGVDGAQGPAGIAGADGADGADGVSATVDVGTTITGAPGTMASVSGTGTPLARILNFTIPRGNTGAQGPAGPAGADGIDGTNGADGADGADGVGVPVGGSTGQVLAKASATNYDTAWVDQTGGGGGATLDAQGLICYPLVLRKTAQSLLYATSISGPTSVGPTAVTVTFERMLLYPVYVAEDSDLALPNGAYYLSAGTSASAYTRFGIYAHNAATMEPGTKLYESLTSTTHTTTGVKTFAFSPQPTLARGIYWLAFAYQGASVTTSIMGFNNVNCPMVGAGAKNNANNFNVSRAGYFQDSVSGTLPTTVTFSRFNTVPYIPHILL